jgi:hypothetical protein
VSVGARYPFTEDREDVRVREDFFRATALNATPERPDAFSPCFGALMILRTAATRSELRPRISPISSGVGTGLPMTWALMYPFYDSLGQARGQPNFRPPIRAVVGAPIKDASDRKFWNRSRSGR